MKCFLLLIPMYMLVAVAECGRRDENVTKVMTNAEKLSDEDNKSEETDGEVKKPPIGKRQLGGNLFHVPKGNAYSYAHVVQTHGPSRKVVHAPEPHHAYPRDDFQDQRLDAEAGYSPGEQGDEDYGYYGPTKEPYFGPIYVTARPVLPTKPDGYQDGRTGQAVETNLQTHEDRLVPFAYPLFRPYYNNADKQYTIPVQVVYRVPVQRNIAFQQLQQPYPFDLQNNYNRLEAYPVERPLAYTVQRPYVNQIAPTGSLPYPFYLANNYVAGYANQDSGSQQAPNNAYNSDESNR